MGFWYIGVYIGVPLFMVSTSSALRLDTAARLLKFLQEVQVLESHD